MVRLDDRLACIENTLVDRKKYFDEMPFFHSANLCWQPNSRAIGSIEDQGKNLKLKLRPESEHQYNSPWNIAADFKISMRLWAEQIAVMLGEYETDNQTGMDIHAVQKKSMHTRRDTRC